MKVDDGSSEVLLYLEIVVAVTLNRVETQQFATKFSPEVQIWIGRLLIWLSECYGKARWVNVIECMGVLYRLVGRRTCR